MSHGTGRAHALLSAIPPLLLFGGAALAFLLWGRGVLHGMHAQVILAFSLFALWRYGWQLTHYLRAAWYAGWHYPRLRAAAEQAAAGRAWPSRIFVVVPSYLEEAWVSASAMQALLANLAELPCKATVVVALGSDQDEAVVGAACRGHAALGQVEVVCQRQSQGKRIALGHALRAVARRYDHEADSVTVFMDGDSWLEPGALRRVLPFFMAYRDLGAVTTNEEVYLPAGGAWYRDWFRLKFGLRQVLFQSHSLSHRVLTLTGRFSVFRTSIVVAEDFLALIENDTIEHWLHGRFRFLMGDDKSSWFHVLKSGWSMLYLPDVTCVSLESRQASFLQASISLPYRWFGNTLRNNPRALALGPGHTGWFIWLVLLDQRLSMWTSLVGIAGASVLAITKSALYLPLYVAWAVAVRSVQLVVIAWHGHPVTLRTIPIMLYTQWVGSLVKIRAWHHLADQNWSKGKANQRVAASGGWPRRLVPTGRMLVAYVAFALVILLGHSALRLPGTELFAAQRHAHAAAAAMLAAANAAPAPLAALADVRADDGRDDAAALQALIESAPPGPVRLRLPAGQLDFHRPLVIRRDDVSITGAGADRTRIVSWLRKPEPAVFRIEGAPGPRLGSLARPAGEQEAQLQLSGGQQPAAGDLLWLRQPNDEKLFRALGSEQWRREYPYLRQALVRVAGAAGDVVRLAEPVGTALDTGTTQVMQVRPVRGVRLADFSIEQRAGERAIGSVAHRYENLEPDFAVDAISLMWTQDAVVDGVAIRAAGRHPLNIEQSHGFLVRNCLIDGAWNKGEGGSGYLRIARSHRGMVEGCTVRGIRHIALQWSASHNQLRNIDSAVDINFHGGYAHHNRVDEVRFALPPQHPWPQVYITPRNARWAPPDGPGNLVNGRAANTAPAAGAASPAR
ncbi:MAG: hypothetical protein JWP65_744 [Ramlibacter sp.]|uniref:glycosyltransferase n=1 Tax=Ramlibacter sp. TaxID=1917967 RepID=UPI00261B3C07|nr:glycosyltransferase [Ramlibacter sp.]MDB5750323.1 hypothetical protein [Ramlibacter sp.]